MAKAKTFMDIFNDVAVKKFGVAARDIPGRQAHFEEIMTDAMRIYNKRLKDRLRRGGFNADTDKSGGTPGGGNNA